MTAPLRTLATADPQGYLLGFGKSLDEQIALSLEVLRHWEPFALKHDPIDGYWGAFSGGKDSVVIKALAAEAGVRVKWHYNVTTIDSPELVQFIREHHPDVVFERPRRGFFGLLADERGYPLRHRRWCCQEFKECGGYERVKITGVRAAESQRRAKGWKQFQRWDAKRSHGKSEQSSWVVNPILYWRDEQVWEFIRLRSLAYCSLYDEGFKRLGCVGCPMAGAKGIAREFARWPRFERAWRRAFHRLWKRKAGQPMTCGKGKGKTWPGIPGIENADQLFDWWKSGKAAPGEDEDEECQLGLW